MTQTKNVDTETRADLRHAANGHLKFIITNFVTLANLNRQLKSEEIQALIAKYGFTQIIAHMPNTVDLSTPGYTPGNVFLTIFTSLNQHGSSTDLQKELSEKLNIKLRTIRNMPRTNKSL